jgi:hypothetical protein
MQDILARSFVVFLLALYAGIALVFVIAGIRKWIWRPIAERISPSRGGKSYRRIKSTSREESLS